MKARFISTDETEGPCEFLGYLFPVNIWVEIDPKDGPTLAAMPPFEVDNGKKPKAPVEGA